MKITLRVLDRNYREKIIEEVGMEKEVWRKVYIDGEIATQNEVSNFGNYRRGDYEYKLSIKENNYVSMTLYLMDNTIKYRNVHRMVLTAFVPLKSKEDYRIYDVNHIDGDKTNNRLDNLEWCTKKQNMAHAFKNNLVGGVIKVNQYEYDGTYVATYDNCAIPERKYGMASGQLSGILKTNQNQQGFGYQWREYSKELGTNDTEPLENYKRAPTNGRIFQVDIITNTIVNTFDNLSLVYEFFNKQDNGHISHACKKQIKMAWGYEWYYEEDTALKKLEYHKECNTGKFNEVLESYEVKFIHKYGGLYKIDPLTLEVVQWYKSQTQVYAERGTTDTGYLVRKCKEKDIHKSKAWGFYWRYAKDYNLNKSTYKKHT